MRFLDNTEIKNWSDSFNTVDINSNWSSVRVGAVSGVVSFGDRYFQFLPGDRNSILIYTSDFKYTPLINYSFVFSVSKTKKDLFISVLTDFLNSGFQFYLSLNLVKIDRYSINFYGEKKNPTAILSDLNVEEFSKFLSISEHTIGGVDFVKFSYKFEKVDLYRLIAFVTCLRDSVDYISEWIYDDSGNEVRLPKVGDIVSLKTDRSSDYLINKVEYIRKNEIKLTDSITKTNITKCKGFTFELVKVNFSKKDVVIYDNNFIYVKLDDIVNSRNSVISDILSN